MRFHFATLAISSLLLFGCIDDSEVPSPSPSPENEALEIPDVTVDVLTLQYDKETSYWKEGGELFSGYAVSWHQDSSLATKIGIYGGRKQGQASRWYPDGHLRSVANYQNGKLHGAKKNWIAHSDHILVAHLNYHSGKPHGTQTKWYQTGELYKVLNLNAGKEEGIQRAFRKNGELYANYEAKNGRIFGLKKASLCYGLEDEKMNNGK